MLPSMKRTATAAVAAVSIAAASVSPVQALGKNEENFLKGVAATLLVTTIINRARMQQQPSRVQQYNPPRYVEPTPRYVQPTPVYAPAQPAYSVHRLPSAQAFNAFSSAERRMIQRNLAAYGYYTGAIDGVWGPRTYRAVQAYAQRTGMGADLDSFRGSLGVFDNLMG